MTQRLTLLAVLTAGGLASACATYTPAAPVLEYDHSNCDAAPVLSGAISLTPTKERVSHVVSTPVTAETACLTTATGPTPYIVYALPADFGDKTVTVGGVLDVTRIFSPDVQILNARGETTRSFAAEDYMYRGPVYSVQFRPRADEAYVLVSANPQRVGQAYNSIAISTQTTGTVAAGAYISWTSGSDSAQVRTFSYEGPVQVTIYDTDTEESAAGSR